MNTVSSLIRAGRAHPITVNGVPSRGHRVLQAGRIFSRRRIPMLRGREVEDRERQGSAPVAVVSDLFARTCFGEENPLGQYLEVRGSSPLKPQIIGVAATARYGGLKGEYPARRIPLIRAGPVIAAADVAQRIPVDAERECHLGLLASYGPARKASHVDPMIALRHE